MHGISGSYNFDKIFQYKGYLTSAGFRQTDTDEISRVAKVTRLEQSDSSKLKTSHHQLKTTQILCLTWPLSCSGNMEAFFKIDFLCIIWNNVTSEESNPVKVLHVFFLSINAFKH